MIFLTRNKSNDYFESMRYWQDLFIITHYHKRKHFPRNLAGRSGPMVRSSLPNFTLIGTTCPQKLAVSKNNTGRAERPVADPAGKKSTVPRTHMGQKMD